jgi:MinD-like ATPase involved in chromosome partitioning or flagellar assembly
VTGRYEEPAAPRHEAAWQPPTHAGQAEQPPAGPEQSGPHPSPEQPPAGQHAAAEHPTPSYVDPSGSGPYYVDPNTGQPESAATPYYVEPTGSGGFPAPGPFPPPPGPFPAPPTGTQSGPYPAPGHQSGPYPAPGHQSGPYPAPGAQSGPYPAPGTQSGPHPVSGGPSGPHQVGEAPPGYYPQPFPFQQRYPQGGPMQPPAPMPPGAMPPGQAPHPNLSRQAIAAAHELSTSHLIRQVKRPPQSGWRRAVYKATGHAVNLGESNADVHRRDLISRINQPLRGCYKIAMLSLKGGVGKTTMTTTLGSTFASLRGDRVVAVDANPDRGTLSQKIPLETTATVRHLLRDAARITRYSDVRAYTSQGPSRLEVLASEQDPAVSEAFSEDDYRRTIDLLEHFYNIVLTDCGTGLMHSAMRGVLDIADSLVIVSSGSVDGARSASATLDWLDAHGYHDLVARSVAVINSVRPRSGAVDLDKLAEHFGSRCRAVCRIPFDPHLEEGAEIELDRLAPQTRTALLELGATVADDFPSDMTRR